MHLNDFDIIDISAFTNLYFDNDNNDGKERDRDIDNSDESSIRSHNKSKAKATPNEKNLASLRKCVCY